MSEQAVRINSLYSNVASSPVVGDALTVSFINLVHGLVPSRPSGYLNISGYLFWLLKGYHQVALNVNVTNQRFIHFSFSLLFL